MQLELHEKVFLALVSPTVVIAITIAAFMFTPKTFSDTEISGSFWRSQIWSGEIIVTGDTLIRGSLTVEPGTTVKFKVQNDQKDGAPDPTHLVDPNNTEEYVKTHSRVQVKRNFIAIGTEEQPITFTSAAKQPAYADWIAIYFYGNGSEFQNTIVEYARDGLRKLGDRDESG